jgi:hypothetical protein
MTEHGALDVINAGPELRVELQQPFAGTSSGDGHDETLYVLLLYFFFFFWLHPMGIFFSQKRCLETTSAMDIGLCVEACTT